MFDLAIKNGILVSDNSVTRANIYIDGERIGAVCPPDENYDACEVYDAAGRYVLPGLVDAHVHFRDPGLVHKEGFENGSLAAACGGVTTVVIMPTDDPMTDDPVTFREKIALGRRSFVDFGLNVIVGPNPGDLGALAECGPCAFELFLADVPDHYRIADAGQLLTALRAIAAVGGVAGVTPMLDSIIRTRTDELRAQGRAAPLDFAASRPPEAEALGIALACEAAILAECRLHIRQVSSREGVDAVAAYKERAPGLISAETLPHNMFLNEDHLRALGPFAKMAPPLRLPEQGQALIAGVKAGALDIVVTDHAPHLPQEKELGRDDIWKAPSGVPGLETLLPVMLARSLGGEIDLTQMVAALSTTPAKLFGLFPRKGLVAPGADADLIVVDQSVRRKIEPTSMKTRASSTPFLDFEGAGTIDLVMLRGRRVVEDGMPVGDPCGSFIRPVRQGQFR
ncbi:dihydroorotase family protein [Aquamicrobium ahrensii]|uniref:Dihydroorotase n=1 Tax=Aquamicrobium ahrensii TaxID=469551 RepID=A0ABV2KM67_9HYPH